MRVAELAGKPARHGRAMEAEIRLILTAAATEEEGPRTDLWLPDGRRKHDLHQAANEIFAAFPRQVLPFDLAAATAYADVVAGREADGNPISGFDGQIAAICRSQAATLATRNTKDFIHTGISLIDPWQETAI
jgi:plasmid stability protein